MVQEAFAQREQCLVVPSPFCWNVSAVRSRKDGGRIGWGERREHVIDHFHSEPLFR
jgi:hypothetical protein